jgi:hypothetical protein
VKWRGGEWVFIGLEGNIRLVLGSMFVCYSPVVQRLLRTSRYYLALNPKSSVRPVILSVCLCTIHKVQRTICQLRSSGTPVYVHQP